MQQRKTHGSFGVRRHDTAAAKARAAFLLKRPLCIVCMRRGQLVPASQVDHIVPLFKGGIDDDRNKQSLCDACHKVKTALDAGKTRYPGCDANGEPLGVAW